MRLLGDERALIALVTTLSDDEKQVHYAAALALGRLGDERAIEPLIEALSDQDERLRRLAAGALAELGDKRAVKPLIGALSDQDEGLRRLAASALGQLSDKKAINPLFAALSDEDAGVRLYAALALGQLGDKRMVEPLLVALTDKDERVRRLAAFALGRFGDDNQVLESLISSLRDKDWRVRGVVAFVLGQIGDVRSISELERLAKDEQNKNVQNTATVSLNHVKAKNFANLGMRLSEAELLAEETVRRQPDNVVFYDTLGWVRYKRKKYVDAITILEEATKLQKGVAAVHYHLGLAYLQTQQIEKGLKQLEAAFSLEGRFREVAKSEDLGIIQKIPEFQQLVNR